MYIHEHTNSYNIRSTFKRNLIIYAYSYLVNSVHWSLNQIFSYLSITACLLPKQKYIFFYIMQGLYNYFKNLSTFAKTLKKISTCFVFFTAWQNVKLCWKRTQKSYIIIAMMNAELRNYGHPPYDWQARKTSVYYSCKIQTVKSFTLYTAAFTSPLTIWFLC